MTTPTPTMTNATSATSEKLLRIAHVVITPRDRAALSLSFADAGAAIAKAFGPICVGVSGVSTRNDAWSAAVVVDVRKASDQKAASLLAAHPSDERLWRTFVEAAYTDGSCSVLEMEATSTSSPPQRASR